VGFVHNYQVPVCESELLLKVLVAGKLVQARHNQVKIVKWIAAVALFNLASSKYGEGKPEFFPHLILPLLDKTAWRNDENSLRIGPHKQLTDKQPRHDGFASAGVVSKDVTKRLARQHRLIDSRDLVWQRCYVGRMHRHHRIKKMSQVDTVGFGGKFEISAGCIKSPRPPGLGQRQVGFIRAKEHTFKKTAVRRLVIDGERVVADGFSCNHAYNLVWLNTGDGRIFFNVFEFQHATHNLPRKTNCQ